MTKKILPVVFDKTNKLSKILTSMNIEHIDTEYGSKKLYKDHRFASLDKFFVTYDDQNIKNINSEYPGYQIYLIKTFEDIKEYPNNTVCAIDINDVINIYTAKNIKFYSCKELIELKEKNADYIYIDLDIFIVGKIITGTLINGSSTCTAINGIAHVIDSIRGPVIMDDKYLINKACTYYCGEKNVELLHSLYIDHFIELKQPNNNTNEFSRANLYNQINDTKLYNLIDKTKYTYTWKAYKEIKIYIDSLEKLATNFQCNVDEKVPKILICIDLSSISPLTQHINIQTEIRNVIASAVTIWDRENTNIYSEYGTTPNDREIIYVAKDVFAIGTEKIMKYYMTLFDHYGLYGSENNNLYVPTFMIHPDSYKVLAIKGRLMAEVQLLEHIRCFGDIILMDALNINNDSGILIKKRYLFL